MSIFSDSYTGELNGSSLFESRAEAFIIILIACGHSDGDFNNIEIGNISELLQRRPALQHVNLVSTSRRLPKLMKELGGLDQLLAAAAKVLTPSQREAAFVNAIDLAFTDGQFREEEVEFLLRVQDYLDLDEEFGEQALHIIGIKNRI